MKRNIWSHDEMLLSHSFRVAFKKIRLGLRIYEKEESLGFDALLSTLKYIIKF